MANYSLKYKVKVNELENICSSTTKKSADRKVDPSKLAVKELIDLIHAHQNIQRYYLLVLLLPNNNRNRSKEIF